MSDDNDELNELPPPEVLAQIVKLLGFDPFEDHQNVDYPDDEDIDGGTGAD